MLHIVPASARASTLPPASDPYWPEPRGVQTRKLLAPRTILFHEGFPTAPQYRLAEGCVALSQTLVDGRRQIVDIVGPGGLIGLSFGERNRVTAETLSYCQIQSVRPRDTDGMSSAFGEIMVRIEAHTMLLGRKTALERVATAILDLADRFGRPRRNRRAALTFNLYLARADLADWLGLTVETVSRCFTRFKRSGLIDFSDPEVVTLVDATALRAIACGSGTADS